MTMINNTIIQKCNLLKTKKSEKPKANQREQQNPRVLELSETKQGENGKRKLKQKGKNRRTVRLD